MAERPTRPPASPWRHAPAPPRRPAAAPTPGTTAADRLERLLYILPAACRPGGVGLAELAERLGVDERTVVGDVQQVLERAYHLPAGSEGDVQIFLEAERLEVWTPGEFHRPVRLSPREALATGLALRMAALSPTGGDGERREALRRRIEAHLARDGGGEALSHFHAPELGAEDVEPDGVREALGQCARERRPCRIRYLKPGAAEPEDRVVHPYLMVHAEGAWYVVGRCLQTDGVKRFRTDRVLEAVAEEGRFDVPADFEAAEHLGGARAFHAEQAGEAQVRYSPRVARWIAERETGEWLGDGSFQVLHPVADPSWLARHVLQYAGEAEVVAPAALRAEVAAQAQRLSARHR